MDNVFFVRWELKCYVLFSCPFQFQIRKQKVIWQVYVPCMLTVQIQTAALDYVPIFNMCRHRKTYSFCKTVPRSTVMTGGFTELISYCRCSLRSVCWKQWSLSEISGFRRDSFYVFSLFWGFTQLWWVFVYRWPERAYLSHSQESSNLELFDPWKKKKNREDLKPHTEIYCTYGYVQYERDTCWKAVRLLKLNLK